MATVEQIKELLKSTKEEIVESITKQLDKRFDDFKKEIDGKVANATTMIADMKKDYDKKLEDSVKRAKDAEELVAEMKEELCTLKDDIRKKNVLAEYHSKQNNIIVGGFEDKNEWENTEDTLEFVNTLLFDILHVPNAHNIDILACHRLPRRPLVAKTRAQQQKIKKRPIIFKVAGENAKQAIFKQLSKLKDYNRGKTTDERIYIDSQLPKIFADQKKALLDEFKVARDNKRKAKWRVNYKTAEYCLYVNDKRVIATDNASNTDTAVILPTNE